MLPMTGLSHRRVSEVRAGNLIYLLRQLGPELAIRVDHPPGAPGGQTFAAAVVLHDSVGRRRMTLVDGGCRAEICIDWGISPTLLWEHPLDARPRTVEATPDPGYLVLTGDQLALTSYPAGGRGYRMYWNVYTGTAVEPGASDFAIIAHWRLGVTANDGSFLQLAEYPNDYGEIQQPR